LPPFKPERRYNRYRLHVESETLREIERVITLTKDSKSKWFRDAIYLHLERCKKVHGIK
jgi:hypothetical protein